MIEQRPLVSMKEMLAVRRLLVETYPVTPLAWNWEVRRWDGSCFYSERPALQADWLPRTRLWIQFGRVVAAVHPDGGSHVVLQLHPNYRRLETEMLDWAEAHCADPDSEGRRALDIEVQEYDAVRRDLLAARGFEPTEYMGYTRRLTVTHAPVVVPALAAGYTLRTTDPVDPGDCRRIADLLNAAFGRTSHTGAEYRNFTLQAPSFRADLDLVAEAPDGSFGAYVGIPFDDANRLGIFEPVCTHPHHRRRGLARTLMLEGLRRLQTLNARAVMVGTGTMEAANRLYDGLDFTEKVQGTVWRKRL